MAKNIMIALVAFALAIGLAFAAGSVLESESAILPIDDSSPCPAVGCASGECHDYASVPVPDGVHEMNCPEASCSSVECHAWDTLSQRYRQASDASLNVWILAPVVLVVALVGLVKLLSGPSFGQGRAGKGEDDG